jgi:hypothetical protein
MKEESTLPQLNQTELDAMDQNRMQDAMRSLRARYRRTPDAKLMLALVTADRRVTPAPANAASHQ